MRPTPTGAVGKSLPPPQIPQHLPRRIVSRCAGDAAAGVGAGGAEVQPAHGGAVVGVAKDGARGVELVEGEGAVEDVAAQEAEVALEVEGGEDLAGEDALPEVRGVAVDGVDDRVGGGFLRVVPGLAIGQGRVEVLAEEAGDVFSFG